MHHKYLHLRRNTYHFRWRIPSDLRSIFGITELTSSLHTSDYLLAIVRAGRFVSIVVGIKLIRCAYQAKQIDIDDYVSELKRYSGEVRSMSKEKTYKTGLITFYNPDGSKFCDIDHQGDERKEALGAKELKDTGLLPSYLESAPPVIDDSGLLFSELFQKFIEHKLDPIIARQGGRRPLTVRMQKQYHRDFAALVEIMGNVAVSNITRKMLEVAILAFGGLPKRNIKPYNQMTLVEILEMEIPEEHLVSDKGPSEVKKMVQGIFRYAVFDEILETSPAQNLNVKFSTRRTFANFSKDDVRKILMALAKEKQSWKRWIPLLAAYTGARRSELVQLRKQDIKLDSDSKRHYILITDEAGSVKNENAKRQIPLHPILLQTGFMEVVESANDRLFDGLNPHSVTNWFTSLRDGLGIERFDDYGNRRVFHSFRHTFITLSRAVNSTELVQQVVGHEKTSAGTTDRYTHNLPLGDVLDVVDKVSYI